MCFSLSQSRRPSYPSRKSCLGATSANSSFFWDTRKFLPAFTFNRPHHVQATHFRFNLISSGSGKTTFFKRHFAPADYLHINQDTLGTKAKCTATIREALEDPLNRLDGEADFDPYEDRPRGCVVDNTNRSAATRGTYVRLATQLGIPIRLFHFTASEALARHNDAYRAMTHTPNLGEKRRVTLPALAYITYRNDFEPPTMEEGFDEIIEVDFKFEGRDEQRKQWSMWCR